MFFVLKQNISVSLKGFDTGKEANMILNTMCWERREVVVLRENQAETVGDVEQVDAAGNCLGISLSYVTLLLRQMPCTS